MVVTFLLIGVPFIIIGYVLKTASDGVVEYVVQYDGAGTSEAQYSACHIDNGTQSRMCSVTISVAAKMAPPVYVYYQLDNFYQNHRRYVKSRSDKQLAGAEYTDSSAVSDCDPLRTATDGNVTRLLDPCGLIANSYFNDTIALNNNTAAAIMLENDISWSSDRSKKFVAPSAAWVNASRGSVQFIDTTYPGVASVTNEHFIVWMRVAALPSFRKLYGRITTEIPAGTTMTFSLQTNFPVTGFDGKKSLVLSTVSFLGGKNPFLGIAYMAVGALCVALAVCFGLRQLCGGRRLGDTTFLVWSTKR